MCHANFPMFKLEWCKVLMDSGLLEGHNELCGSDAWSKDPDLNVKLTSILHRCSQKGMSKHSTFLRMLHFNESDIDHELINVHLL